MMRKHRILLSEIAAVLLLGFFVYLRFGSVLSGARTIILPMDTTDMTYPDMKFIFDSYKNGSVPFWDPHQFFGYSMIGYPQYGIFYPIIILFALCLRLLNQSFSFATYNFYVVLHIFLSGYFSYLLFKTLKLQYWSRLAGALVYMFSPTILGFVVWGHQLAAFSWFPLLIMFLLKFFDTDKKIYFGASLAALTMIFLASPAQPSIQAVFVVVMFALYKFGNSIYELIKHNRSKKSEEAFRKQLRTCFKALLIVATAFLFTSIMFFSIFEFTKGSMRFLGPDGALIGSQKMPFSAFISHRFHKDKIIGLLLPKLSRGSVSSTYFGIIPFFFFCIFPLTYLFNKKYLRDNLFWFLLASFSIIYSFGKIFPIIFYRIPFLNLVREPERYVLFVNLSLSILAATSLNEISKKLNKYFVLFFGIFSVIVMYFDMGRYSYPSWPVTSFDIGEYYNSQSKVFTAMDKDNSDYSYRFASVESGKGWPIMNNAATLANRYDAFGYGNPVDFRIMNNRGSDSFCSAFNRLMNVKYLITDTDSDSRLGACVKDLVKLAELDDVNKVDMTDKRITVPNRVLLYKNNNPSNYVIVGNNIEVSDENTEEVLKSNYPHSIVVSNKQSYVKKLIVNDENAYQLSYQVNSVQKSNNKIDVSINTNGKAVVAVSELYYPGWRVSVNGKPRELIKAYNYLDGVLVERGTSNIVFYYLPTYLWPGIILLVLSLTFLVGLTWLNFKNWDIYYGCMIAPLLFYFMYVYLHLLG